LSAAFTMVAVLAFISVPAVFFLPKGQSQQSQAM
jgi:hypothetical protein